MRTFDTGATRDTDNGKYAFDGFFSPEVLQCYSGFMERERAYAWAAGIFEGEGCVYLNKNQRPPQPRLQIRMTDRDILDRFCAIAGRGKVYGPYVTRQSVKGKVVVNPKWKPNYAWQVHGQDAVEVARMIFPYLGIRRAARIAEIFGQCRSGSPAFLPADVLQEFGRYMHDHRIQSDGSLRNADNWKRGIPLDSYISSAWRHLQDVWLHHEGRSDLARESLENAICALLFNAQGYLHELLKAKRA